MSSSMGPKRSKFIRKIYDTFLFSTAVVGVVISFTGVLHPRNTYIRCNDPYISHDFQKDTVSISTLLLVSLLGPWIIMIIFEWINLFHVPIPRPFYTSLKRSYSFFISLVIGNLFCFFIVEILKTAVSEPRPNFMSTCSPNLTKDLCKYQWIHVTWENCSNPFNFSYTKLIDTMKSFPSGHASISVFSTVFITMYICERVTVPWSKLLSPWLQLLWWIWSLLCCASRVWDHKHHWWDVIFGGILGAIAGYATVKCMCYSFRDRPKENVSSDVKVSKENGKLTGENNFYNKPDLEEKEASSHHTSTEPIVKELFDE